MTQTLWTLRPNESAFFSGFTESIDPNYRIRLREIGLESNVTIECIKVIPFEGPKIYQICDSVFSLDKEIALHVLIKKVAK